MLMKIVLFILMSFLINGACLAEISQHDDSSIESDLGFRWEDGSEDSAEREVASEEEYEDDSNFEEGESERDLASEGQEGGIQFWKYEGEE